MSGADISRMPTSLLARRRASLLGRRRDEGFTLIELMVVMIIIGILAGIAIPIYLHQQRSARSAAAKSDLRNAAIQIRTYGLDLGSDYTLLSPTALTADGITIRTSADTVIYLVQQTKAGFCLAAFDSKSLPLPTTKANFKTLSTNARYWWDSQSGGLQPTSTPIKAGSGCPVTSGLGSKAGTLTWSS